MNRTLVIETLAGGPAPGTARAEALPGFDHPTRGRVRCPAAPAVAADLAERLGGPERAAAGESVIEALSYLDRDGHATGLAVAARREDAEAVSVARHVLRDWRPAMRTRRVLIADAAPEGRDACRHHAAAATSVVDFVSRGDTVALIGDPASRGAGRLADEVRRVGGVAAFVGDPAQASADLGDPERLSYVVVPGTRVEVATRLLSMLRARYPALRGQHPDEFCYGASDRYETFRSIAAASESVLLLTGPDQARLEDAHAEDSFAGDAVRMLTEQGVHWRLVSDPASLRPRDLRSSTVGVVPVGSASRADVNATLRLLGGLGPLSVRRRTTRTEPWEPVSTTMIANAEFSPGVYA